MLSFSLRVLNMSLDLIINYSIFGNIYSLYLKLLANHRQQVESFHRGVGDTHTSGNLRGG